MFELSDKPIDGTALRAAMMPVPSAGALVVFEGWVRDHNEGQAVGSLSYEAAAALCGAEANKIIVEVRQRWDVTGIRCVHRVGHLRIGEVAVWVGVTAGHRDAAFAACRYVIDEVKARLPIWKKEHYADGRDRWIGA
jgi:molybdopterin synthase catalytic subunit